MAYLARIDIEAFLNQARIKLTGSSDAGIKAEFFQVCKEFFKDSQAWTEDITFNVIQNTVDYPIVPQQGGQIIGLVGVFDVNMIPVPAFMSNFGTIHLVSASTTTPVNQPTVWTARVWKNVVRPTNREDIPVVPDWVLRVYEITILDGILGKMMTQMNKSYSDAQNGKYHLQRFQTGIQSARTAAVRQNTKGAQEWAFPNGWRSSSQRGGVSTAWPTRAF